MAFSRTSNEFRRRLIALLPVLLLPGCMHPGAPTSPDLLADGRRWIVEAERDARVTFHDGVLDIDSPAGVTVWLQQEITGPVEISFEATAVASGGANDQVSDLNVFWMATNTDGTAPFTRRRQGRFAEYNDLLTYYVGLGGNRNSTSRFRRYIGDAELRPLRPEHDLSSPDVLLVPNAKQSVTLVADRHTIEYRRDGRTLFRLEDPQPYQRGWFGFRTTQSHLRLANLRIRTPR